LGFGFGEYLSCVRSIYSRQTWKLISNMVLMVF
jgi:hypothetical protein